MLLLVNTDQIFKNENYRGGWIHDKARRRRSVRTPCHREFRLKPAEADRKAKAHRWEGVRRRSRSKREPWSAKTRKGSSRLGRGFFVDLLLVFQNFSGTFDEE